MYDNSQDIIRLAAIDIGSNAVRLLINNVVEGDEPYFKKASLLRVPIRLGMDAFQHKRISDRNVGRLLDTMRAFQYIMKVNEIATYRACATSAMRDAENGNEIVELIERETGIQIRIIDGKREAQIIFNTHIEERLNPKFAYLYMDVGGGSTEITLIDGKQPVASKSFNIGTVRMISNQVPEEVWDEMKEWLEEKLAKMDKEVQLIGSGGNINRMFKMSGNRAGEPLHQSYLQENYDLIRTLSFKDRMTKLDLNPDRADVIEPALRLFLFVMDVSKAHKVHVPKFGLSDGIIRQLYAEHLLKTKV